MIFDKKKDIILKKKFLKLEYKNKIDKYIFINLISKLNSCNKNYRKNNIPFYLKTYYSTYKINNLFSNKSKFQRRCLFTNKTKITHKKFGISRSILRELMQFGIMPGYKKAVW